MQEGTIFLQIPKLLSTVLSQGSHKFMWEF